MVRSYRLGALLLVTACIGIAHLWGLEPAAPPVADRNLTVGLNGKKHRCRIVQGWAVRGGQAFEVQTNDTNERLTLVRETSAGGVSEAPVRIFRWTDAKTPPPGAPLPPQAGRSTGWKKASEVS